MIRQGQRFNSLQEFREAFRKWSIEARFTPAILDSDSRRVRAGCRSSPGCPFRIRCNYNDAQGYAVVTKLEDKHTCTPASEQETAPRIKRSEIGKLKFLLEAVPPLLKVDRSTTTRAIIDAVSAKYGQRISLRQAQKVKAVLSASAGSRGTTFRADTLDQGDLADPHLDVSAVSKDDALPSIKPRQLDEKWSAAFDEEDLETPSVPSTRHISRRTAPAVEDLEAHADPHATPHPILASQGFLDDNYFDEPQRMIQTRQSATAADFGGGKSASEIRAEAAKLIERASMLMQEAASLTAEAARLNASVVDF